MQVVKSGFVVAVCITYCFVRSDDGETFFLHQKNIASGKHLVNEGARVKFFPAPPALGKRFPSATRAIVGGSNDRN